jgi:hypothetical protein
MSYGKGEIEKFTFYDFSMDDIAKAAIADKR